MMLGTQASGQYAPMPPAKKSGKVNQPIGPSAYHGIIA
jgi:hypothetical protein